MISSVLVRLMFFLFVSVAIHLSSGKRSEVIMIIPKEIGFPCSCVKSPFHGKFFAKVLLSTESDMLTCFFMACAARKVPVRNERWTSPVAPFSEFCVFLW